MSDGRIPEFESDRISFYINYGKGDRPIHTHTKVLLIDNVPVYGISWKESVDANGINEPEPSNYEVYASWKLTYTSKNNGGICWD